MTDPRETAPLPERPNVEQLRKRARRLQRQVRAGDPEMLARLGLTEADPDFPLHAAHRALARYHRFASWPRLVAHVAAIERRTWSLSTPDDEPVLHRVARLACLTYDGDPIDPDAARVVLDEHPHLVTTELAAAAMTADAESLASLLAAGASVAGPAGPFGWPALMYLTYSRLPAPRDATLAAARLLLDAGADPDDGRYFGGWPTPFTVITGVFGNGERDEPTHPHCAELAGVLLDAGADPNDAQTLYNRMFGRADDFLEILFAHGLGTGDGGPWRRRLPDLTQSPTDMLRALLAWAVTHDQQDRVRLLAAHGVDVVNPLPDGPGPYRADGTPISTAVLSGNRAMADLLRHLGAGEPALDPVDTVVAALLAGDSRSVSATPAEVLAAARRRRPGLIVWAAAQGRPDAVSLVAASGFDVDALARSDVPLEQPWQTALHTAVEHDDAATLQVLLALGADTSIEDRRFHATAAQWAEHFERPGLIAVLNGTAGRTGDDGTGNAGA